MKQPISVKEAAKILKITDVAVLKRIATGKLLGKPLSGSQKGIMVCHESVLGQPFTPTEFDRVCERYISVPRACDIVCVTDGMVIRMLEDGRLSGFKLNEKCWAVDRRSCEKNIEEYLHSPPAGGRPRNLGSSRAPKSRRPAAEKKVLARR